jgi:DNA invertase Pin-like site-specific DNA recombinase
MKFAIAYIRVSTQRQGKSGLSLEAQQAALARFAETGYSLFLPEVETAKGDDGLSSCGFLDYATAGLRRS